MGCMACMLTQEKNGARHGSQREGYAPTPEHSASADVDGRGDNDPCDGAALHQRVEASPPFWRRHLAGVDEGAVVAKAHADAPQNAAHEEHRN